MKIGVTGANGLLGWHFRAFLRAKGGCEVRSADRSTFASPDRLATFTEGLDGLAHFAGMNRGEDAEVERVNVELARSLVAALDRSRARPRLVYANSTHVERQTAYGRGKREAAALLRTWSKRAESPFADLVLPHVFGEFGKPFYNSVVSTFCHQLARREEPEIIVDGDLELVHAQQVAERCFVALSAGEDGVSRMSGTPIKVSALLARLRAMAAAYRSEVVPDLTSELDLRLFNTLRSYLYPDHYPVSLTLRTDARGSLCEAVKSQAGGQVFLSTSHPGVTRGNHFHTRKVERFFVAAGEAEIRLRKLFGGEVRTFRVSGEHPCYIDMPTFHTHNITNVGRSQLTTLFWSNEIFDPADPDTFAEPVS